LNGAAERVVRLESGQAVEIGRDAGNGVVIDDVGVSRHHARIVPDGDGWAIEDLGSANGTWFKGERVERASLRDGDRFRLGDSELVFFDHGAAPLPPEVAAPEIAVDATPQADGGADAHYFLSRHGERLGPYTWPEVTAHASNGRVVSDDLLWGPGLEQWTAAGLIPGLIAAAPAVASGPPPLPRPRARRSLATVLLVAGPIVLLGIVLLVAVSRLGGPGGGGGDGDDWQAAVLGPDDDDWQSYPDLAVEKKKIESSLDAFQNALREGDIDQAASWIAEDRRGAYAVLFANRPEAMASFAELLDNSELSYFGPPEEPAADLRLRIAEYTVTSDDFDFYLRWAKVGDTWVLLDF
jgi:hypothetical protein